MNILLTSAGRRTSLLKAFQEAAHPRGGKVFAADLDPLAPAVHLADGAFRVPPVRDRAYIPTLLALTGEAQIRLLVPTIDTELAPLAAHVQAFADQGTTVLISTPAFVDICGDKWSTFLAYQEAGIDVPASWLPGDFPAVLPEHLFLKPRNGSASAHTHATHPGELEHLLPRVPQPILQERLEGEEITIDALLDFTGRPLHYVPRTRIRTLGGESIQGVTLDASELDPWIIQVLEISGQLGARGPITLQAFRTSRGPVLTEINPRFGGGFPLAQAAGGRYPAWILEQLDGRTLPVRLGEFKKGLFMTRTYTEIFTDFAKWR